MAFTATLHQPPFPLLEAPTKVHYSYERECDHTPERFIIEEVHLILPIWCGLTSRWVNQAIEVNPQACDLAALREACSEHYDNGDHHGHN